MRVCQHHVLKWDEIAPIALRLSQLDTGSAGLSARIYLSYCSDTSHFPKHHRSINPCAFENLFPSIYIEGNKKSQIKLEIYWVGHLDLPELSSKKGLTAELMHQKLEQELRPGVAEYIAPEQPPGRLPEMLSLRCKPMRLSSVSRPGTAWSWLVPYASAGDWFPNMPHRR